MTIISGFGIVNVQTPDVFTSMARSYFRSECRNLFGTLKVWNPGSLYLTIIIYLNALTFGMLFSMSEFICDIKSLIFRQYRVHLALKYYREPLLSKDENNKYSEYGLTSPAPRNDEILTLYPV
jgi:hypothetical protein